MLFKRWICLTPKRFAMRHLMLLPVIAALAGCAASAGDQPRSPQAQQQLDRYLAGKVAGPPQACLATFRRDDMITIDERTILFRDGANRVYRNDPPGGCNGLGRPGIALVTRSFGTSQLCRGDIAHTADLTAGFTVGSCTLGDFVPYTTPGTR